VLALIVSDVTGDDPTHVASGPCAPDPTTIADARAVLKKYGIAAPGEFSETPKPGDPLFARVENRVIATARRSLEAAAAVFAARGIAPVVLGDDIIGEAREVAKAMAAQARAARGPSVLISGGECTVTVRGEGGRGGRCGEFLLALAVALEGVPNVHAIAADTDGIDGSEDNAGAVIAPDTLARAAARGLDAQALLEANDSYEFFSALGDLVVTGPTRTNVNDYRAILLA
jgi:hydroxypyruvate reductase